MLLLDNTLINNEQLVLYWINKLLKLSENIKTEKKKKKKPVKSTWHSSVIYDDICNNNQMAYGFWILLEDVL